MSWNSFLDNLRAALGPDALKTTLAPSVAILLFMLSNLAQWLAGRREARRATKRVVLGLYTEISHNMKYTRVTAANTTLRETIKSRLQADEDRAVSAQTLPEFRPLIVITDSSMFYEANLNAVIEIDPKCIAPVLLYYRSVADQHLAMAAINGDAFLKVSLEGRLGTVDDLWRALEESSSTGAAALKTLRSSYPRSWFASLKLL